ncbi:MAG: mechanosensitive ion channel family protein [Pseudomonadota bacterium]
MSEASKPVTENTVETQTASDTNSAPAENADQVSEQLVDAPVSITAELPKIVDLLPESAQPYWQLIQQIPILEAIVIIALFWLLAAIIRKFAISSIIRLTAHTENELDDQVIEILRVPIFSTVVWIGVLIGSAAAGFSGAWAGYIPNVVASIIVLIWLRVSLSLSSIIFTTISRDPNRFKKIDVRTEPLLIITSKLLLLVIGAYILLVIWGINPVGLLASAGIVGIAVGFAAKDTLANLFSGVFILADRPYKLGDYVNLSSGERGKVTHIGIRSTRLLTRDDIEITIPNGVIGNEKVINESGGPYQKMRIRLNLQCAYEDDLEGVTDLLMQIADEEELVCKYPSPRVRVRGFADSGIDIQLMAWIEKPEDRGRTKHILFMKVHEQFKQHGFEIPYPKREITVTNSG